MTNGAKHIEIIVRGVWRLADHLLLCQPRGGAYYYLPGGHVEPGESSADALAREFREETGLSVIVGDVLAVQELVFDDKKRVRRHEINIMICVMCADWVVDDSGNPRKVTPAEEQINFSWIHFDQIEMVKLMPPAVARWLTSPEAIGSDCRWIP